MTIHRAALASAFVLSAAAVVGFARPAAAQRVYVYPAPPPPPPPPPPPGYYYRQAPGEYAVRGPDQALALGVDVEGAVPVNVPQFEGRDSLAGGGGFKLRVGDRIRLRGGVHVIPEVGYGFEHLFASNGFGDAFSWDLHRVFAGARLEFGRILVPVLYAHAGYGWRDTADPTVPSANGLNLDFGGALDLHLIPHLSVGAHVEYAIIEAQPVSPQWVALGLHAQLWL